MLALEEIIVDTHDDYTPWADCLVGFNDDGDFVVRYNFIDYDYRERSYTREAVIKKDNALEVAQFLGVHLIDLPMHLEEKFGQPLDSSTAGEVKSIFEDLLNYISANKGNYQLHRLAIQE